jgi:hypothetical protein
MGMYGVPVFIALVLFAVHKQLLDAIHEKHWMTAAMCLAGNVIAYAGAVGWWFVGMPVKRGVMRVGAGWFGHYSEAESNAMHFWIGVGFAGLLGTYALIAVRGMVHYLSRKERTQAAFSLWTALLAVMFLVIWFLPHVMNEGDLTAR